MGDVAQVVTDAWGARKERAAVLQQRYPFAREMLDLLAALLPVQEAAFLAARAAPPAPGRIAGYVAERVVPGVLAVTVDHGPPQLVEALAQIDAATDAQGTIAGWMFGDAQPIAQRYVARASLGPVLEAMGDLAAPAFTQPPGGRYCPRCAGPPQLSYFAAAEDGASMDTRHLVCARCNAEWEYPRIACASCGKQSGSSLSTAEGVFPHVRIEGCDTCRRYLLNVDVGVEATAVPLVDEMTALPLDLYARDRGLTKITPNLMGY